MYEERKILWRGTLLIYFLSKIRRRRGRDRIVADFITMYAISAYHR